MPETPSAAGNQPAQDDLISFLKAIPDGRYRRGVRYPQWYLLLVAVLGVVDDVVDDAEEAPCLLLRDVRFILAR